MGLWGNNIIGGGLKGIGGIKIGDTAIGGNGNSASKSAGFKTISADTYSSLSLASYNTNPDHITGGGRFQSYRELKETDGITRVIGTDRNDIITVTYDISSNKTGMVHISVGNGNDIIQIGGNITGTGYNVIEMGTGNKSLSANKLDAWSGAQNTISAQDGSHSFSFQSIVSANSGKNTIQTMADTNALNVTGSIEVNNGQNSFTFGNGNNTITLGAYIKATGKNGLNEFATGDGCTILTVNNDIYTTGGGINRFDMGDGAHIVNIKGKLDNHGGLNEFQFATITPINSGGQLIDIGEHIISIGSLYADSLGINRIASKGAASINITNKMENRNAVNEILTQAGDDFITIGQGLYATDGKNLISTGAGNDYVYIGGRVQANPAGNNTINTGSGDDIIELNGVIELGSLHINGGTGNDMLILHASTVQQFDGNYHQWLTNFAVKGELASSGLETIRVNIDSSFDLGTIGWLIDLIDKHNLINPGASVKLEVTGHTDQAFSFGDLFPQAGANEIPGLGSNDNVPGHNGDLSAFSNSDILFNAFGNPADDILAQAGLNVAIV